MPAHLFLCFSIISLGIYAKDLYVSSDNYCLLSLAHFVISLGPLSSLQLERPTKLTQWIQITILFLIYLLKALKPHLLLRDLGKSMPVVPVMACIKLV